jgi:murein DD-endopeptidase MepM/ murein hydrolase activator NlpD
MTQYNNSNRKLMSQKSLLIKSFSLIGVFSVLSGNQVFAQTESSSDHLVPLPTVETTPTTPVKTPQASTDRLQRLQRKLTTPKVNIVRPEAAPQPKVSTYVPPQAVTTRRTPIQKTQDYNGAFIDPTNYSTGATSTYQAPSQVIFSQRSTGCNAVKQLCGTPQRQTRMATSGNSNLQKTQPNASWVRDSRATATTAILPVRANTHRLRYANSERSPINGQKAVSKTAFLPKIPVSSYYNRIIRPTGLLGNNDTNMMFPLPMPATITSLFGWRIHPITGEQRFHAGTDFGVETGTPVLAAYSGNVAIADLMGGYGLAVVLNHQKLGEQTLYGHLSEILVQPGQSVEQGTVIGLVGSTGNSTGSHLHFEVRQLTNQGWVATDPGVQLQGAVAQLVEALRVADSGKQKQETN